MPSELDTRPFRLSREQLEDVRAALAERIREGLAADQQEIAALPSYYRAPDRSRTGRALVIDTGGTNMRAAVVAVEEGGRTQLVKGPLKKRLTARETKLDGGAFFAMQAELAKELDVPIGLPVGYCFSYPALNTPEGDSRLIKWTKNVEIEGVEGTLVGERLSAALKDAGLEPQSVHVLNDTVASMLGGALTHAELEADRFIGLIVGTGTNMAAFFDAEQAPKLPRNFSGKMAINLETGNFTPPHLTPLDEELDRESDNPGRQRFEKAVSGYYLPFLFDRLWPHHSAFEPQLGSAALVDFRDRGLEHLSQEAADALLSRSADLVAASIAAVVDLYGAGGTIGVLAEGSLIWGDPKYGPRVADTLSQLLGGPERAKLLKTEDANLVGSAIVALT